MRNVSYDGINNLPDILLKNLANTLGLTTINLFDENKPKITFWKVTYKRGENFSIEQVDNGEADFGRRVTCTISRDGDLAYKTTSMTNNNT